MKYYVTIYIDPLIECFIDFKNKCYWKREDATHAFLGLTKDKSPDELDKIKLERDVKYWDYSLGKMVTFRKEEYKWYETMDTNEYNDGFWGFGTGVSGISGVFNVAGEVFENNQYAVKDKL
ncbi:hypothetical protein CQA53_10155 [Helicobacter didelphidarum]|uniref:Uncharacterized protein n=1 Tax=Helicobacter didelphidarum TaxID=2040648 RepID=A0A3D8I8B0_9HELI|nr:hypothetical protein [Helicobacter didelphidarum]RDU61413.1 hypothetical protein CQA53_10155 [Helicobacter didelphidarum]